MQQVKSIHPQPEGESQTERSRVDNMSTRGALMIITFLFFMWGLLTSLNDVLIPHLKAIYDLSYVQAMMVQFCFFGAYFIVSVPAGTLIKKIGYQNGIVTGLLIAAGGCALFYPAAMGSYAVFLIAFFILATGITILQVAANPYVTILGTSATASSRLTLTQAFNSLGTTVAPFLGGILILSVVSIGQADLARLSPADQLAQHAREATSVQTPYLILAATLVALAVIFSVIKLPKIVDAIEPVQIGQSKKMSIFSYRHLVLGAIGIFVYVGGEVSIGSFMINFLGEKDVAGLATADAARFVGLYWGGAMVGRFIGFAVMRYVSPGKTLAFNALCAVGLVLVAVFSQGPFAMWSIIAVGLCNSIMFPTIFSMSLHRLGARTGQGSGLLCMAIVGGALVPFLQGALADHFGLHLSFVLPALCYMYIAFFGFHYAGMYSEQQDHEVIV